MPAPPLRTIPPLIAALVATLVAAPVASAPSAEAQQTAAAYDAAVVPPQPVTLTAGWQYRADRAYIGRKAGWRRGAWADTWQDVEVPHVFNPTPVDREFLGTVGWYRRKLVTPPTPSGFGWALRFDGARRTTSVYLNGRQIGRNVNP